MFEIDEMFSNKRKPKVIERNNSLSMYKKYLQSRYLQSEDTFNTTYKTYYNNIKLFLDYVEAYIGNVYILSPEFQEDFTDTWENYSLYCIKNLHNSKRTIANKRVALSSFFDWCVKRRLISVNPFVYIDKIKITDQDKVRESYFLTPQQIWEIKYTMQHNSKKFDLQDKLLFSLFLDSGCRISEIHSLTLKQLDLDEMVFNDVRHKEGYIESVIFFDETKKLLKELIEERMKKGVVSQYLFVTQYSKKYNQMSKETIRARIRKMGQIVGIKDFYPHSIRKTILNIAGKQSQSVAMALGHHKTVDVTIKHYMKKQQLKEIRSSLQQIREFSGI